MDPRFVEVAEFLPGLLTILPPRLAIRETVSFAIAPKIIKYLGVKLLMEMENIDSEKI